MMIQSIYFYNKLYGTDFEYGGHLVISTGFNKETLKIILAETSPVAELVYKDFEEVREAMIFDLWMEMIYVIKEEKIFILDKNIRYFDELILFRLKNNLPTILLDLHDGFSLSHNKKYLPEVELRKNFKYISCIGREDLIGKKVNLISNGEKGQVLIFNNDLEMTDKYITDRKRSFNFTFKNNDFDFPKDKVTSIAGVIFDKNGDIVTIELDRGIDIPGGHIKEGENIEEALIRECKEEAFIEIGDLKITSIIESDYFGTEKEDLTYMLIFSGKLKKEFLFQENEESRKRIYISPEKFLSEYSGDKELMEKIIFNALNCK